MTAKKIVKKIRDYDDGLVNWRLRTLSRNTAPRKSRQILESTLLPHMERTARKILSKRYGAANAATWESLEAHLRGNGSHWSNNLSKEPIKLRHALTLYQRTAIGERRLREGRGYEAAIHFIKAGQALGLLESLLHSKRLKIAEKSLKGSQKGAKARAYTRAEKDDLAREAKQLFESSSAARVPAKVQYVAKHARVAPHETVKGITIETARERLRFAGVLPPPKPRKPRGK